MMVTDERPTLAALQVLGDRQRLRILTLLTTGEHCVCELTATLQLAPNTVSHHLRQLSAHGLVLSRKKPTDQRWVYYRIDPEGLAAVAQLLLTWSEAAQGAPHREPDCPV